VTVSPPARAPKKSGSGVSALGRPPSEAQVRRLLGPARPAWDALLGVGQRRREWKRYSVKYDWVVRVHDGKRTLLWLRPVAGELHVTLILGGKAVAAGLASALPERLKSRLRAAPVYPEGRVVRVGLRSARGVPDVERLLALKLGS